MATKLPVGILGATGIVGQRFIQMLEQHPWFEVGWLAASERSEGRPYAEAVRWRMRTALPDQIARMTLSPAAPEDAPKVIFAALDAAIAAELEPRFAEAGCAVISNSSALRMYPDVPLVIPEVNPDHLKLIECQRWRRKSGGFAVTNPNCSAIGLVLALRPLQQRFGLETVMAVTMQAVSGAGYPGVASLDILGNVIPYIAKEEEKMEEETGKLLGQLVNGAGVQRGHFRMSAQCNRVAVEDGHTESVWVKLKKKAQPEEIISAWQDFRGVPQELELPSAPHRPVKYLSSPDRPQPRLDADAGAGMTATVGRLRACSVLDWKFTILSHNTIRGAAGAALLNAELLKAQGYLG
jgi:aspartate-semialdehyde dehydrogenase